MMAVISAGLHWTDFPMTDQMYVLSLPVRAAKEIINKEIYKREQDMSLKDRINNAVLKIDPYRMPTKKFWKCKQVEAMKC